MDEAVSILLDPLLRKFSRPQSQGSNVAPVTPVAKLAKQSPKHDIDCQTGSTAEASAAVPVLASGPAESQFWSFSELFLSKANFSVPKGCLIFIWSLKFL